MRTIKLFAMAAAVCSVLFACSQVIEPETVIEEQPEETGTPAVKPGVFALTLSMPETKTVFGAKDGVTYPKKWSEGDKISVNGIESDALTLGQGAGTACATFTFETNGAPDAPYSVVYPSSAYDGGTGKVTIPATQAYVEGSFDPAADIILGYGTTADGIELHNAVAYLKIKLISGDYGNFGVSSIKLTAAGKMLNGAFAVGGGGTELTVPGSSANASEETITLNVDGVTSLNAEAKEFLIAVAPQTLAGGFTVTVTDPKGNTMDKTKAGSATLTANKILAQPAFKFQEYVSIKTPTDLLDFAAACTAADDNYYVIEANIDMDGQVWPVAGTADDDDHSFRGTLDGGNKGDDTGFAISNLTSNTGAFVNYLNVSGTIKNLTLASTCSINYSSAVASALQMGVVGYSHGTITNCYNNAPVNCTSSSISAAIYIGGIVGHQVHSGPITGCVNNAAITCSVTNGGKNPVYVGGIAGTVVCEGSSDTAIVSQCSNHGSISRGTLDAASNNSVHHMGGVIGWLCASNDYKHTHSYLVNDGAVTGPNYQTATNKIAQFVGGIIGGIHDSTEPSGKVKVVIDHCTSQNCTIQNLFRNNGSDGGTGMASYDKQCHNGGLIGYVRGSATVNSVELTNNLVNNVTVFSTRGYAGGLCGYARGTTVSNTNILSSQVSGAQVFRAGGVAGCIYDGVVDGCIAQLTKTSDFNVAAFTDNSSLYAATVNYIGGIAGEVSGASVSIMNSKAYVNGLCQGTETAGCRGWIAGMCDCTASEIKKCGLGGTYFNKSSVSITLSGENFGSYIYGSSSTGVTPGTGDNACYYWDGTI